MKPLWAVAGVALLGITGAVGAVIVASSGEEEEVVQQVETATPTGGGAKDPRNTPTDSPSAATETPAGCDPNPSPAPGNMLFRWGDISVQIPSDGSVEAFGLVADDYSGPTLRLSSYDEIYIDATTGELIRQTYVDPTTGASLPLEPVPNPERDAVLETISVCPFDAAAAPWPHNGEPPASTPQVLGRARYIEPDPASGVQVLIGGECANGCRDAVAVRSARSQMQIDAKTGEMWLHSTKIADEDREAFERYRASIQFDEAQ